MGQASWSCSCGFTNRARIKNCVSCGATRVRSAQSEAHGQRCPYDGEFLSEDETGWYCERGTGYPYALLNPQYNPFGKGPETMVRRFPQHRKTACPHCRERLEWDGGCLTCHGAPSGQRED